MFAQTTRTRTSNNAVLISRSVPYSTIWERQTNRKFHPASTAIDYANKSKFESFWNYLYFPFSQIRISKKPSQNKNNVISIDITVRIR